MHNITSFFFIYLKVLKILILLTNNSSGVYYLHLTIHNYFRFFIDAMKKSTFFGVIINYLQYNQ